MFITKMIAYYQYVMFNQQQLHWLTRADSYSSKCTDNHAHPLLTAIPSVADKIHYNMDPALRGPSKVTEKNVTDRKCWTKNKT